MRFRFLHRGDSLASPIPKPFQLALPVPFWLSALILALACSVKNLCADTVIPASAADITIIGAEPKDTATTAETAGDVNKDGFGDLILGAENACVGGLHATG